VRVVCYPADTAGCGSFRVIWPAQALAAAGHDVEIRPPEDRGLKLRIGPGERVDDVLDIDGVDVMVFQRLTHQWMAEAVPLLRAKGVAVVIDVDDDLTTVHPRNPAYRSMHPSNAGKRDRATGQIHRHSWQHLTAACREATLVRARTSASSGTRWAPAVRSAFSTIRRGARVSALTAGRRPWPGTSASASRRWRTPRSTGPNRG
jgi:hypothetical protein